MLPLRSKPLCLIFLICLDAPVVNSYHRYQLSERTKMRNVYENRGNSILLLLKRKIK